MSKYLTKEDISEEELKFDREAFEYMKEENEHMAELALLASRPIDPFVSTDEGTFKYDLMDVPDFFKEPKRRSPYAVGIDIMNLEEVVMRPFEEYTFKTKLFINYNNIPLRHFIQLRVRSSTFMILLRGGVIDPDYKEEIFYSLYNPMMKEVTMKKGQYYIQALILPYASAPLRGFKNNLLGPTCSAFNALTLKRPVIKPSSLLLPRQVLQGYIYFLDIIQLYIFLKLYCCRKGGNRTEIEGSFPEFHKFSLKNSRLDLLRIDDLVNRHIFSEYACTPYCFFNYEEENAVFREERGFNDDNYEAIKRKIDYEGKVAFFTHKRLLFHHIYKMYFRNDIYIRNQIVPM